jgi:oligoendopeptidase F
MSIPPTALPHWDDSLMAAAVGSKAVDAQLDSITARAAEIASRWMGKVAKLDAEQFEVFIGAYQDCVADLQRLTSYAELAIASGKYAAEGTNALARCDVAWSRLSSALGFVEPELAAMDAVTASQHVSLSASGTLGNFFRRVVNARSADPAVRDFLAAVRPSGTDGWQTLALQLFSRIQVASSDGATSVGNAMLGLYQAERRRRQDAQRGISDALAGELDLRATALSMIVADGVIRAELTGSSWFNEGLLSDQLTEAEVHALVAATDAAYPLVHRYFQVKARLLGRTRLDEADRYAPCGDGDAELTWDQAVDIVLASFDAVHPRCGAAARELLAAGRVDAAHRPGKQAPFTKYVPGELPWISVNFDGSLRQVLLLAHELGHGVHMMLASDLPYLAAATPRVLAETVALFFEAATLLHLSRSAAPAAVAALTTRWVEDQLVGACRQAAIYQFETALRDQWQVAGNLDAATISGEWLKAQRRLYGDAMAISDDFGPWWSCLNGVFQSPGTCYSYVYGQFAAAALAEHFATAGTDFAERLMALMAAGGSAPPRELLSLAGIDPLSPETWRDTVASFDRQVSACEAAVASTATGTETFDGSQWPARGHATAQAGGR